MKIAKQKLRQIIKEELLKVLNETTDVDGDGDTDPQDVLAVAKAAADEDDFATWGPQEENQELVVAANDALHEALQAVKNLETVSDFNMDAPITLADVGNKIHYINRSWRKIQGE